MLLFIINGNGLLYRFLFKSKEGSLLEENSRGVVENSYRFEEKFLTIFLTNL